MSRMQQGPESDEDLCGQTLDARWEVEAQIGAGGMGRVWRARDLAEDRLVAIKVLRAEMVHTEDLFARFKQEVDAASRIGDPRIAKVYAFGETQGGQPYYAMEFCDGPDLLLVLKREGRMPWRRAFAIASQICSSLAAAHAAGIIHRDVKPENFILVEAEGQGEGEAAGELVKVLDFGIAKLMDPDVAAIETQTGVSVGTPEYMSPEQGEGLELDGRVDIYGVGVLLYQLITGKVPFTGIDEFEIMQRHMAELPALPSAVLREAGQDPLPSIVDAVIMQALEKERDDRFADMDRFRRSLDGACARDDHSLSAEGLSAPLERSGPSRLIPAIVLVLLLALVIIALLAMAL